MLVNDLRLVKEMSFFITVVQGWNLVGIVTVLEIQVTRQLKNTLEGHLGVALLNQLAFPGCAEAGQELVEDLHRLSQRRLLVVLAHSLPGLVFLELFKDNCYDEAFHHG